MSNDLTLEQITAIIERTAWKPAEYFVYFDQVTGELRSIANELLSDNRSYIKVNFAEVSAILDCKEPVSNYRVVLDFKTGEYILQNVANEGIRSFNWNDEVHHIPKTDNLASSIVIKQNTVTHTWKLEVSDAVLKILSKQATGMNYNLSFYVTAVDDVNILYSILKFPVADVIKHGTAVISDMSASSRKSIYCRNVFDSYSHIII